LEPAINGFKPLKSIQQLQAGFAYLIGSRSKLLGAFDGETDSIYRDPRLVGHFKFSRRWSGLHFGFDRLSNCDALLILYTHPRRTISLQETLIAMRHRSSKADAARIILNPSCDYRIAASAMIAATSPTESSDMVLSNIHK
jgi:hypothetical protein